LIDLDTDVLLLPAFLEGETLHMALAAAELAMGGEGFFRPYRRTLIVPSPCQGNGGSASLGRDPRE
jgi:hypothetical protein